MSNYTKATNFATKDTLVSGDPNKVVKGTELDNEFNAISGAVSSKADLASPAFTGTPSAPTATAGTNTTQVATTAYVRTEMGTLGTISTQNANAVAITGGTISGITDLTVADGGTGASSITANSVILGNGTSALSGNLVAPSTSGNLLTSNGTSWVSSPPVGVTSLNGQTGAITNTTFAAIGSYFYAIDISIPAFESGGGTVSPGGTVAGSNLYYATESGTTYDRDSFDPTRYTSAGLSGTWRRMSHYVKQDRTDLPDYRPVFMFVRIS